MRSSFSLLLAPLCAAPFCCTVADAAPKAVIPKAVAPKTIVKAAKVAVAPLPSLEGWNYQLSDDETEDNWTWTARLTPAKGAWEARIIFNQADAKNFDFLQIAGDGNRATARFYRALAGSVEKEGDPPASFDIGSGGPFALQKSAANIRLLWNGRAVTTATPSSTGTRLGTAAKGATLANARMQPLEDVLMRDDFMRAQGPDEAPVTGGWTRISGTWKTSNMLGPRANIELNPNPFVYRGQDDGKTGAVALSGSWFWNDYTVAAAVHPNMENPAAPLTAGLQAYRQSDGSSIRGEVDFKTGIARISDGKRVLAQSKPFDAEPNQWHRLYLEPGPGITRLLVDGVERVRANTADSAPLAQGEAALYVLSGVNSVDFDDVRVASNPSLNDNFSMPSVGKWTDIAGSWQTRIASAGTPARRVKVSPAAGLSVTGSSERTEGTVEAHFAPTSTSPVGVAFAVRDAQNYYLARRAVVGKSTVLQIAAIEKGAERILDSAPNAGNGDIKVAWREGEITATAGNARAVAAVSEIPVGRVGAWAGAGKAGGASLLSFSALGAPPTFGEEKLPDKFAKDRLMDNWASAASLWQATGEKPGAPRRHVGDFFADSGVTVALPAPKANATLDVSLGALASDNSGGARLSLTSDGTAWNATLREGETTVGTAKIDVTAPALLRFARRPVNGENMSLRVAVDGKSVLSATAPRDGKGTRAAIATNIEGFDWNGASAQTSNVLDYGFTGAPVDWRAAKGEWSVAGRWTCSPQWAFFGGGNDVNATLWSRFALRGDWTLEAYLATPMDSTRGERSPTDLNLSIGDGRDLASGYSFLFGANTRQRNRVMRGDTVVKDAAYVEPKGEGNTHQDWFYVRLERRMTPQGLRFIYTVNGQQMWDYTDANPLESVTKAPPHLAFWTYNGGLSIARVRLWHAGVETGSAPQLARKEAARAGAAPTTSFGALQPRRDGLYDSAVLIGQPEKTARVVNPVSGGDWTVFVSKTAYDAREKPTLSWRYRVGPDVLVNLYALVEGRWREIDWTGGTIKLPRRAPGIDGASGTGEADPMRIGAIADVKVDSQWHDARFDLRAALEKAHLPLQVDGLAFAAPDRDYLRAGLGGNHFGAQYEIADFKSEAAKLAAN